MNEWMHELKEAYTVVETEVRSLGLNFVYTDYLGGILNLCLSFNVFSGDNNNT